MSEEIQLLTEIRDLLQVMAEPAIAVRDKKKREMLVKIVGNSSKKASSALLMDGSRSQAAISKQAAIDPGDLSRLVKSLGEADLISGNQKLPQLVLKVPADLFEKGGSR